MTSFTDKKGQAWDVEFTLAELMRVKSRLGLSLANLTKAEVEHNAIPDDKTGKLKLTGGRAKEDLDKLTNDIVLFIDALYVVIEPQAKSRGLGSEAFAGILDADALLSAIDCFNSELMLFTQSRANQPRARTAIQRWATANNRLLETERARMLATLESEALTAETSLASPNGASNSPASSAVSTP